MVEIFSPNMLKTYESCPKKYYFKYIKGLSMPINEDIFLKGKKIHAIASYYLKGENIDLMEKSLSTAEFQVWQYLKNLKYFNYKCINTEYNLSVKIGNNFFGGRLDALVKNNDIYFILDYKTGSIPKNADLDFQTIIYLLAVKDFYKSENIIFVYLDLKNKQELQIKLNSELIKIYYDKISNIQNKINMKEYIANKKNCIHCEYGKICYEKILN